MKHTRVLAVCAIATTLVGFSSVSAAVASPRTDESQVAVSVDGPDRGATEPGLERSDQQAAPSAFFADGHTTLVLPLALVQSDARIAVFANDRYTAETYAGNVLHATSRIIGDRVGIELGGVKPGDHLQVRVVSGLPGDPVDSTSPGHALLDVHVQNRTRTLTLGQVRRLQTVPFPVYAEIHYELPGGGFEKSVTPVLRPGGDPVTTTVPGDAKEVDIQLRRESGEIVMEEQYPGLIPDGQPVVTWKSGPWWAPDGFHIDWN
ncbi:hypothetical protein [Rathayibacter sp. VKM Ac-2760]|uniref:hypothetical protein n=1 Tax=Rathayibacter sp. VKM Ac-2760 TaxID=2609253 RepID=UPI0013177725|nr:hypothetical protein [Rathayibacter sp. VKM Ac-2760]QHC57547.1 hypothetical protein GSU72_02330 [Rathayibacter sp. VKM Ac-2760]